MTNQKVDFLTVATVDYLSQALVTLQSARERSNYSHLHLFAIDASSDTVFILRKFLKSEYAWINIFGPCDLQVNKLLFLNSFKYFNPLELSCLAKYVGVAHVFESSESADICVYSDADIFFVGNPLSELTKMNKEAILLTPHQFYPSTDSTEQEYLFSGWINAGFFAVKRSAKNSQKILEWLINRISRRGFHAPTIGLYADQAWLSLVPAFFSDDVSISRHAGFNVAYWNLHERQLYIKSNVIYVNDEELIFFHFSGFVGSPHKQLTKHCESSMQGNLVLQDLCAQYKLALTIVEGKVNKFGVCPKIKICNKDIGKRILGGFLANDISLHLPSLGYGFFYRIGRKIDVIIFKLISFYVLSIKKLSNK